MKREAITPCGERSASPAAVSGSGRSVGRRGAVAPGSAWALVTGAGSGIGRCYALRLAALGYNLVLAGNRREPLETVCSEILAAGAGPDGGVRKAASPAAGFRPEVRIVEIDLARIEAAAELWEAVRREGAAIDVLVNNAGIFSFRDILQTPAERIERIILLHDLTNTQLCRMAAADMVRRGCRGHILNMSSYSLWMPFPGASARASGCLSRPTRAPGADCAPCGGDAGASSPTGGTACGFPSARCCRCGCCVRSAGSR